MSIDEDRIEVEEEAIEYSEVEESTEDTPVEEQEEDVVEDEEEDRVVTIGDPEPEEESEEESEEEGEPEETPQWVKTTRKVNREQARKIKKLEKRLEEATRVPEKKIELGPKPTLESSKFDDKKFEADLIAYHDRKRQVEQQQREAEKVVEEQNKAWQNKQTRYVDLKKEHNFKDFQDAEEAVLDAFSNVQQGIIVSGMDDPALVVYALGKNPDKLEELSKITDHVQLAVALAKMEAQLKVTSRKAPKPEKRVSGGKTGSGSADKTLERLRQEADRTHDYTKVREYKQKLRGAK